MVSLPYRWGHFNCLFDVIYLQMDAACFLLFEYRNSSAHSIHIAIRKLLITELIMFWRYRFKPCSVAQAPVTGRMQQSTQMHCVIHSTGQGLHAFSLSYPKSRAAVPSAGQPVGLLPLAVGGQQLLAQESPYPTSSLSLCRWDWPARAVSLPAFCPPFSGLSFLQTSLSPILSPSHLYFMTKKKKHPSVTNFSHFALHHWFTALVKVLYRFHAWHGTHGSSL